MENLLLLFATSLVLRIPSPKFRRFFIGNTGCSVLLFANQKSFQVNYTVDGDKIYFNDYSTGKVTYGIVCIQLSQIYQQEQSEALLRSYLRTAKEPFRIVCSASVKFEKEGESSTCSAYWQDANGKDWKVKGYANGSVLSLLYVRNIGEITVAEQDRFLDSFRFAN